jgi:uncharacterized SAM-binding protein YcdF (DUF218 family)
VKFFSHRFRNRRFSATVGLSLVILLSIIPVRLAIAHYQAPQPQIIFTLGGGDVREVFTAEFAKHHPDLEIWVSSGSSKTLAQSIFRGAGVSMARVRLDYRAVDTVTNFTSMVADLEQRNIQHIYLITSDFHMPRAQAIATIVLGSRGIAFTPIAIPSNHSPEPWYEVLRDSFRALLWLLTGRTGASLNPQL